MGPEVVFQYFPDLSKEKKSQYTQLFPLYLEWNDKINVISRKDIEELYVRHVLHSMSIAKLVTFQPGTELLDIGTGGGFPGIPLAILFPECSFHLVDSIGKKIKVVEAISAELGLKNLSAAHERAEKVKGSFDFILSRAVARSKLLVQWTHRLIKPKDQNSISNGYIFLKGGDLEEEMKELGRPFQEIPISAYFEEGFFETKKIIYIPSN